MVAIGDLVFAKVKGHSPFPARVTEVAAKYCKVLFFVTGEKNSVLKTNIWEFSKKNEEAFQKKCGQKTNFPEALEEMKCHEANKVKKAESLNADDEVDLQGEDAVKMAGEKTKKDASKISTPTESLRGPESEGTAAITDENIVMMENMTDISLGVMEKVKNAESLNADDEVDLQAECTVKIAGEKSKKNACEISTPTESMGGRESEGVVAITDEDIVLMERKKDILLDITQKDTQLKLSLGDKSTSNARNSQSPIQDVSDDSKIRDNELIRSMKTKESGYGNTAMKCNISPTRFESLSPSSNTSPQSTTSSACQWSSTDAIAAIAKVPTKNKKTKLPLKMKFSKKNKASCFSQLVGDTEESLTPEDQEDVSDPETDKLQSSNVKEDKVKLIKAKYSNKIKTEEKNVKKCQDIELKKNVKRQHPSGKPLQDINYLIQEPMINDKICSNVLFDGPKTKKHKKEKKAKKTNEQGKDVKKPDNTWIMFFKDNIERIKKENPGIVYRDISTLLSLEWEELKVKNPEKVEEYNQRYRQNYKEYETIKNEVSRHENKENTPQNVQEIETSALKIELDETYKHLKEVTDENAELKDKNQNLNFEINSIKEEKDEEIKEIKKEKERQTVAFLQCKNLLDMKIKECNSLISKLKKKEKS